MKVENVENKKAIEIQESIKVIHLVEKIVTEVDGLKKLCQNRNHSQNQSIISVQLDLKENNQNHSKSQNQNQNNINVQVY